MKHNLKNKPELYKIPSNITEHLKFETSIIEWFEGFESEEKQRQENLTKRIHEIEDKVGKDKLIKARDSGGFKWQYGFWCYLRGLRERGKEVLGETP